MYGSRRCLTTLAFLLALATGVTACGDDAGDADGNAITTSTSAPATSTTTPTTTSTSAATTSTSAAADRFCTDYLALSQAWSTAPWNGEPSTYPTRDVMAQYYDSAVDPLVNRLAADEVPNAISAEVATFVDIVLRFGAGGADLSAIADPAFYESGEAIDVHAYEQCGFNINDVVGLDDAYTGLPTVLDPGANAFRFTNRTTSGEWHELQLMRKNDGVTQSFDELLSLPENERFEQETLIGKNLAMPGEATYVFADLDPGTYIALCSLPQGTTGHSLGHGPLHFTLGMTHEFIVE